jgi:hypothetical protein
MSGPAEIEACHERLHRAGWSIGEVGTTTGRLVTGPTVRTRSSLPLRLGGNLPMLGVQLPGVVRTPGVRRRVTPNQPLLSFVDEIKRLPGN